MVKRTLTTLLAMMVIAACGQADDLATETPSPTVTVATTTVAAPTETTEAPAVVATTVPRVDRSITVGGIGTEYAAPTRSVVNLAVCSRGQTVEEAGAHASSAGDAMIAALRSAGVEERDIQTSEFSVNPYYDQYPQITGYEVTIGYRVTVGDIESIGEMLGAAIRAGGDDARAWGMRFEADPDGLMQAARTAAWADVEGRAQALADLAGEPLGDVLDIHEKVLLSNSSGMIQGGEGDSASFDIPASPGVAGVIVLLTVTYSIGD